MQRVRRQLTQSVFEIPDSGKVTVACNVPTGLILRISKVEEQEKAVMGGGMRMEKVGLFDEEIEPVVLFGPALPWGARPKCLITDSGYALTPNVDAQFMREWFRQNHNSPLVKNGGVAVFQTEASAADWANGEGRKSGLEPLDMTDDKKMDPRLPKNLGKIVRATTKEDA